MPKKRLYERGPAMDPAPKRMFEGPTLEQIDQAKRGARTPEAIEKSRDMVRKRAIPSQSSNSDPPIKSKFE